MHRRALFPAILLISGAIAFADPPARLEDVPIYPGAAEAPEPALARDEGGPDERVASKASKLYAAAAVPEDVLSWYAGKIGARGRARDEAGDPSRPQYYFWEYEGRDFQDEVIMGKMVYSGTWVRQQLEAHRKRLNGLWVREGQLYWSHAEADGDKTELIVHVYDETFRKHPWISGLNENWTVGAKRRYVPSTYFRIEATRYKSEEAMRDERSAANEKTSDDNARRLAAHPPAEKELGVPLYPGAALDVQASAGMTNPGYAMYLYTSRDDVARVTAFYEKATGRKADNLGGGSFQIRLKGASLMPDHVLLIQPNTMFPGRGKTLITVMKKTD